MHLFSYSSIFRHFSPQKSHVEIYESSLRSPTVYQDIPKTTTFICSKKPLEQTICNIKNILKNKKHSIPSTYKSSTRKYSVKNSNEKKDYGMNEINLKYIQ